jgi:DNA-directed RNA polymerase
LKNKNEKQMVEWIIKRPPEEIEVKTWPWIRYMALVLMPMVGTKIPGEEDGIKTLKATKTGMNRGVKVTTVKNGITTRASRGIKANRIGINTQAVRMAADVGSVADEVVVVDVAAVDVDLINTMVEVEDAAEDEIAASTVQVSNGAVEEIIREESEIGMTTATIAAGADSLPVLPLLII